MEKCVETNMLKSLIRLTLREAFDPDYPNDKDHQYTAIDDQDIKDFTLGYKVGTIVHLEGTPYSAKLEFLGTSKKHLRWIILGSKTNNRGNRYVVAEFNPDFRPLNKPTVRGERSVFIMADIRHTARDFKGNVFDAMEYVSMRSMKQT